MKLSTKILLLIAPVILCSTAMSSYIIYTNQKDAFIKREENSLQLDMEKLAGHFRQARSFLNSYSYTLTKSDIIKRYFLLKDNPYRELELVENLKETINLLQDGNNSFTGLALLDGNRDVLYYAENSHEQLAQIDPKILEHINYSYQSTLETSNISYTRNSQGEGMLVRYEVLDQRTLATPLSYQVDDVFFVVVSVSLDKFNTLRKQIEYDYQTSLFFSSERIQTKTGLTQSILLSPALYATVDPAPFLMRNKLNSIWNEITASFVLSAFVTMGLVLTLLYRTIITPITRLDSQLKQVERRQRKNIERLGSNDEIGRLSDRFYTMYQELDNTYQQTKILAEKDQLTQIANRHQFQNHAEVSLSVPNINRSIWVLYLDLDNFKFVNDKYGHQIGDSILVAFAQRISNICDTYQSHHYATCMVSRLSGDEFSVFINAPANSGNVAKDFSDQLLAPMQHGFITELGNFPITASIGIATYPSDGDNIEKLISNADTAMYQAKRAGKNQHAYYSLDLDKVVQRRADIERALRENHFDDEFKLMYMPYLDTAGQKVIGVEVLLRWFSKELGFVSPDEFIPIAEQTGLFDLVDKWVIKNAFASFHKVQDQFPHAIQLSINLSSAELETIRLSEFIHQHAKANRIPPELIDFEITETFESESQGFPLLHELARLGYKLAIDDFGSGYTSITQLVQYPVQKIKLDKVFLETLMATNNQHIVKPIIELCHAQNKMVTAEGIETEDMYQWLANYQCDFMQGYYFGKPMPIEELKYWSQTRLSTNTQSLYN
ncbi:putative bifunctional diguanylate cyclase/phosphodiesterase [Vibrio gallaecicus]|uniref:putative bifunctional diguanylate cyclase/phosphodiesterase n=1 Tax=Vibrio gallaecicus TaxID=552386 RepID=UPI0010C9AC84|nr:EAL domain-containing protein [Vibrio gallaecicus]MDN3614157.1 EAL domain-containing protein [Vibrio gallaecicus]